MPAERAMWAGPSGFGLKAACSLVPCVATRHKPDVAVPEIFNRRLRRLRRDRAAAHFTDHDFLVDYIGQGILARLDGIRRDFRNALDLGCHDGRLGHALRAQGMSVASADAGFAFARSAGGILCEEDQLPFADRSFDLVVSAGVLDQVNDLPGALALIKRVLKPDGLMLAGFVGAGSLPLLRKAVLAADMALGGAIGSRVHPLIDVRAAGDLLGRAGFALPVADGEALSVRYSDPVRLLADLRGMAMTNLLAGRHAPHFGRTRLRALLEALSTERDENDKIVERFEIVFMTGWAPDNGQPRPAPRGSAKISMASVLSRRT